MIRRGPLPESKGFTSVSELTGYRATQEQIDRMFTRYWFASTMCAGLDVLELACGSGQGLGLMARRAKSIKGGDFDPDIVALAQKHYGNQIAIEKMDAHSIPVDDESYDAVVLFEAIYYLKDPLLFVREAKRVLRAGGLLLIGSANKEWPGFNPSPFSHHYFSAQELSRLLQEEGFNVELFADCPDHEGGLKNKVCGWIKKVAVGLHLMPKTMKGKELLKRIFMGKLLSLPAELKEGDGTFSPPVPLSNAGVVRNYKVVFALGRIKK